VRPPGAIYRSHFSCGLSTDSSRYLPSAVY
jgi:hypothetical protein